MTNIPLIRVDDESKLGPMERSQRGLDQMVTALMMAGTLTDANMTEQEREIYTTLSVATIIPAEA